MKRWSIRFGILLIGVIVVITLLKWFADGYARRELTAQMRAIGAEKIEIASVDLKWSSIGARGIVVGDESSDAAWIEIDELDTDLTLWQVVRGNTTPRNIVLQGVRVACRVDRDLKQWINAWSGPSQLPVPSLEIRRGEIQVLQGDEELASVADIHAQVSGGQELKASATIGDALGATWELRANLRDGARLELATSDLRLDDEWFNKIPALPPQLKRIKELTAATAVTVELGNFREEDFRYKIAIELRSLHALVADLDFEIDQATVDLVVENDLAQIQQFSGNFAGGQVSLTGQIRLDSDPYEASLAGQVEQLVLSELPAQWAFPPALKGLCDGQANLKLTLNGDEFVAAGELRGTVNEASAADVALRPITFDVSLDRYQMSKDTSSIDGQITVDAGADLDLTELQSKLDPSSPIAASNLLGVLSFDLNLTAPLGDLYNVSRYEGSGTLTSAKLKAGEVEFGQLRSALEIQAGQLVSRLSGRIGNGSVAGQVTAELSDAKRIDATLDARQLQLASIAGLLPEAIANAEGDISAKARVEGSWETIGNLNQWRVKGRLQSSRATWNGKTVTDLSMSVNMHEGQLRLDDVRCTWANTPLNGGGVVDLALSKSFQFHLNVDEANLNTIASTLELLPDDSELHAVASIQAQVNGSLQPFTWTSHGKASLNELRLPSLSIDGCRFQWRMNQQALQIHQLAAELFGGRVTGEGTVPFGGKPYLLKGEFSEIESASLLASSTRQAQLSGPVSGAFALSGPKVDELSRAELQIRAPAISVFGTQATKIEGSATYETKRLTLQLNGRVLDGTFVLSGTGSGEQTDLSDLTIEGQVKTQEVQLASLQPLMKTSQLRTLKGTAQLDLQFKISGPSLSPSCRGSCVISNLALGSTSIVPSARADLALSSDAIRIQNISAQIAEGTASGEITLMRASNDGSFRLTLKNIKARRLAQFGPSAFSKLNGRLNLHLEGNSVRDWRGRGQLDMSRADLAGISIQRLRVPFQWAFLPEGNRWLVVSRDAHANVARGRVSTDLVLAFGRRVDFKCSGRLERISLDEPPRAVPGVGADVGGTLSATFKLDGRGVNSLSDVTGSYQGKVVKSRVLMLPIMQEMAASLGLGPVTRRFDVAEVKGRLSRGGVLRIDRMSMANNNLQMDASGRMWLSGRIDLDVAAHVGEFGLESAVEQTLASPIRALRTASVERIVQAGEFLQRRLLFLHLGGTLRNPTINPRPNQNLDRDAILFFVDQASSQILK